MPNTLPQMIREATGLKRESAYPIAPTWFREAFANHVAFALIDNWDKTPAEADYSSAAERFWIYCQKHWNVGQTDICPVGQKEGRNHSLSWMENTAYGNPQDGGLWSCYDCGGKTYTKFNGEFVEWVGP